MSSKKRVNAARARWYDAKAERPLFPFGYGLSYTRFGYANLTLTESPPRSAASPCGLPWMGCQRRCWAIHCQMWVPLMLGSLRAT